jgi:hypothetical protein
MQGVIWTWLGFVPRPCYRYWILSPAVGMKQVDVVYVRVRIQVPFRKLSIALKSQDRTVDGAGIIIIIGYALQLQIILSAMLHYIHDFAGLSFAMK